LRFWGETRAKNIVCLSVRDMTGHGFFELCLVVAPSVAECNGRMTKFFGFVEESSDECVELGTDGIAGLLVAKKLLKTACDVYKRITDRLWFCGLDEQRNRVFARAGFWENDIGGESFFIPIANGKKIDWAAQAAEDPYFE